MVCSRKTNFPNCFGHYIDCIRSVLGYHISVSPVSNSFQSIGNITSFAVI
jgi:hypothetical protein